MDIHHHETSQVAYPNTLLQGLGLPRRAWTRLNKLRTGVSGFGAKMLRWGLSTSDSCDCRAEEKRQITSQMDVVSFRPNLPPERINRLIELDLNEHGLKTLTWTYIWLVFDGTRNKSRRNIPSHTDKEKMIFVAP